jgi:hypothetical protein
VGRGEQRVGVDLALDWIGAGGAGLSFFPAPRRCLTWDCSALDQGVLGVCCKRQQGVHCNAGCFDELHPAFEAKFPQTPLGVAPNANGVKLICCLCHRGTNMTQYRHLSSSLVQFFYIVVNE